MNHVITSRRISMTKSLTIPPLTDDLVQVLIDAATIERRVDEIASEINRDYRNVSDPLILVGILKGSFIFLSDLSRKLRIPHVIDFIAISSYGNQGTEQGNVRMLMDTRELTAATRLTTSSATSRHAVRRASGSQPSLTRKTVTRLT